MRSARSICVVLALVPALALAAKAPRTRQARPAPAPAQPAVPTTCGEDCLGGYVDKVLQAMMDHDPSHAPLAPDVRYTENGEPAAPGEGLWRTATAIAMEDDGLSSLGRNISAYKLYFADAATGQAAYFGAFTEQGAPGMMMLRLKAAAGKVTEIETVIVRKEPPGGSPDRPAAPPAFDPKGFSGPEPTLLAGGERWAPNIMTAAANRYFDGMERRSSAGVPFSADCVRRDNGVQTTTAGLGCAAQLDGGAFGSTYRVRRRIVTVDEDRGLVMAVAMVDHGILAKPAKKKAKPAAGPQPSPTLSTDLWGVVFKMSDGKITRIEAIERPAANDMGLGWPN